ncbi:unnamed protein product [Pararhodospirillum photometricum DSM 122]|uniref:Uncharacterized protein n=1 Tax=Pararhodospirillum photometricum DSM 122 TaxID=1150469 RepID=H6SJT8_PARPM|nr:unnamed protein product [Pararhodospirillum photometricum DSM 122]
MRPMCCRAPTVEEASFRQTERAQAEADNDRTADMRGPQRVYDVG